MVQALSDHLEAVKAKLPQKKARAKDSRKSERALVEARVYLSGVLYNRHHHPMEVTPAASAATCRALPLPADYRPILACAHGMSTD